MEGRIYTIISTVGSFLKKNHSTPRTSEHPPVMGEKMSKRLGGIKGCKYGNKILDLAQDFPNKILFAENLPKFPDGTVWGLHEVVMRPT